MTDDLVKRLRAAYSRWSNPPSPELPDGARIVLEAADRIEQLEAALRDVTERHQVTHCHAAARAALAPQRG